MPDTMYASTPSPAMPPHAAVADDSTLGDIPSRSSWATASGDDETATDVFREHVSAIVQDKCVDCHIAGGPSGHTRLVFVSSADADHFALNLKAFEDFLKAVEGGADLVLNKVRGVGHGGGTQLPAGGAHYDDMGRFLSLLGGTSTAVALTPGTLFDGVKMLPHREILRRATLVFAGRIPTDEEYVALREVGIRTAIRAAMTGPGFRNFLIRGANDRLLTDREHGLLSNDRAAPLVHYVNEWIHRCQVAQSNAGFFTEENDEWIRRAQFGARRAPLELIAHVVENDLPYTEILTADYVMANPWSAKAYGSMAAFEDPADVHEFQPVTFAAYYLYDDSRESFRDGEGCGEFIVDPGDLRLEFPHAGILNTMAFLSRYPTTATNRNRSRARWTYYHFLGLDVEKSASRTTDPVALADADNPTLKNPACKACHVVLDPVAGAFQNYNEIGHYRATRGGTDSLDYFYKRNPVGGEDFVVEARSFGDRERVFAEGELAAGPNTIGLRAGQGEVAVHGLTVRERDGRLVSRPALLDAAEAATCAVRDDHIIVLDRVCALAVDVDVPRAGAYRVEVDAWVSSSYNYAPVRLTVWVPGSFYREGDTWYRDMRAPGFGTETAPDADRSVRWLAERIVADERFAEAAVKFWWPSVMGAEVASPPELADDADFEGRLLRANAQALEVRRLGGQFRRGVRGGSPYNLKDLLVEIVLSKWFRAMSAPSDDAGRGVALRGAGGGRLLTGEELGAKTLALTGVQWGRVNPNTRFGFGRDPFATDKHALTGDYTILYGGIDSDGVTQRQRNLTAVMLGVAKRHAAEVSCPAVLREFYLLPDGERLLFVGMNPMVSPADAAGQRAIQAKLAQLYDRLLGVRVTTSSPDIRRAYEFFEEVWNSKRALQEPDDDSFIDDWRGAACNLSIDEYYFDSAPNGALLDSDLADPLYVARTWVVMLATLLMDQRYLHL